MDDTRAEIAAIKKRLAELDRLAASQSFSRRLGDELRARGGQTVLQGQRPGFGRTQPPPAEPAADADVVVDGKPDMNILIRLAAGRGVTEEGAEK